MTVLGSKVSDKVTGFEGIATARVEHLFGNPRVLVEQAREKDPPPPDPPADPNAPIAILGRISTGELHDYWFDEGRLEAAS